MATDRGSMLKARELMTVQVDTLFTQDELGRLVTVNEMPHRESAPYLFAGQTEDGVVWRYRIGLPEDICNSLNAIQIPDQWVPGHIDSSLRGAIREVLEGYALPIGSVWHGPAYYFPSRQVDVTTSTVVIGRNNTELLMAHFPRIASRVPQNAPCVAFVQDGRAVAVCRTVRKSPRGAEAGVSTVESYRGRGFGSGVTRKWASMVRNAGVVPFYSTSWENIASQRLADHVGFVQFGTDLHFSEQHP